MKYIKSALFICALSTGINLSYGQTSSNARQASYSLRSTNLWEISGNNLQQKSYIYLTTALCDNKIILSKNVEQALKKVKTVAVESNLNSKANVGKLPKLITVENDSQRIKNILSLAAYNQILATAKEKYGMSEQLLNQFKPFYINSFLLRNANPCESASVERIEDELDDFAKKNNLDYKELFSPEEMITEYNQYPSGYWQQNILYIFNNTDQVRIILQNKNSLYTTENVQGLEMLFALNPYYKLKYTSSVVKEHVQATLPKIESIIKSQPAFITIDAGYFLATDNSLIEQLRKAGYSINPVK